MKNSMRVFCLAAIIVVAMSGMVQAEEAKSQASLEETLDFIKNKVELIQQHSVYESNMTRTYKFNHNNCSVELIERHDYVDKPKYYKAFSSFNLKDIGDVKIGGNGTTLQLNTINNYKKIKYWTRWSDGGGDEAYTSGTGISFDSGSDLPDRLAKAFTHAANLCGGGPANQKKEPF